ncbi:hypothetical protein UACE39S_01425 [Ureibacillus acetophenoni]
MKQVVFELLKKSLPTREIQKIKKINDNIFLIDGKKAYASYAKEDMNKSNNSDEEFDVCGNYPFSITPQNRQEVDLIIVFTLTSNSFFIIDKKVFNQIHYNLGDNNRYNFRILTDEHSVNFYLRGAKEENNDVEKNLIDITDLRQPIPIDDEEIITITIGLRHSI